MKIIDAHIHFKHSYGFDELAVAAGHQNNEEHLRKVFSDLNIEHAVVMGNNGIAEPHEYPSFMSYCVGFDSGHFSKEALASSLELVENHLRRDVCAGIKLYPGYNRHYITEPFYHPLYDLAGQYGKAIAIHSGATAGPRSYLKYCHPLVVDEAAADFPKTTFVICHYGNPWVVDTAAVLDKNPNVCADLSGILDGGLHDIDAFIRDNSGYVDHLKTWLRYPHAFDRIMYGTDWPLVNMEQYIDFISRLVPEQHWDEVFYENAVRIYKIKK